MSPCTNSWATSTRKPFMKASRPRSMRNSMASRLASVRSTVSLCSPSVMAVWMTRRSSVMPDVFLTALRPVTRASHGMVMLRLSWMGLTSNLTHSCPSLVKSLMRSAWRVEVFAPESTRAFTAGTPSLGNRHHSTLPITFMAADFVQRRIKICPGKPAVGLLSVLPFHEDSANQRTTSGLRQPHSATSTK